MERRIVRRLNKAWSEEARLASIAARRGRASGGPRYRTGTRRRYITQSNEHIQSYPEEVAARARRERMATEGQQLNIMAPGGDQASGVQPEQKKRNIHQDSVMMLNNVGENTPDSTTTTRRIEVQGRYVRPGRSSEPLTRADTILDYGHVNDLLKEKYGDERGEAMYRSMIDSVESGTFFTTGRDIQREKRTMAHNLGKRGALSQHDYQALYGLWTDWRARQK